MTDNQTTEMSVKKVIRIIMCILLIPVAVMSYWLIGMVVIMMVGAGIVQWATNNDEWDTRETFTLAGWVLISPWVEMYKFIQNKKK